MSVSAKIFHFNWANQRRYTYSLIRSSRGQKFGIWRPTTPDHRVLMSKECFEHVPIIIQIPTLEIRNYSEINMKIFTKLYFSKWQNHLYSPYLECFVQ